MLLARFSFAASHWRNCRRVGCRPLGGTSLEWRSLSCASVVVWITSLIFVSCVVLVFHGVRLWRRAGITRITRRLQSTIEPRPTNEKWVLRYSTLSPELEWWSVHLVRHWMPLIIRMCVTRIRSLPFCLPVIQGWVSYYRSAQTERTFD